MLKTRTLLISGAASYLLFLLALTPAATVFSMLPLRAGLVETSGIQGTVWSGQIDSLKLQRTRLDNVHWDLSPLSLLAATVSSDISAEYFSQRFTGSIAYALLSQSVEVSDLRSTVKAAGLSEQLNLPFGELGGLINVNINQAMLSENKLSSIQASVNWLNAQLTLSDSIKFGSVKIDISTEESGDIKGTISNSKGDVDINGTLMLSADRNYRLNLNMTPRSGAPEELLSMLRLIAPRKSGSTHQLVRQGNLKRLGINI